MATTDSHVHLWHAEEFTHTGPLEVATTDQYKYNAQH